jgi:hypothetical protein
MLRKSLLAGLLGGFLLLGGATPAAARSCYDKIQRAQQKLEEAILKHGSFSREAEKRQRELDHLRATCRDRSYNYGNPQRHDFDRDRHDHDHDRDHDRDRHHHDHDGDHHDHNHHGGGDHHDHHDHGGSDHHDHDGDHHRH